MDYASRLLPIRVGPVHLKTPPQGNHLTKQLGDVERLLMDHDVTSASNPQGSELVLASDSPISGAHTRLGRGPRTFGSSEDTVLFGGQSQPAMEGYAPQLLKTGKVAIPRRSNPEIVTSNKRVGRACDPCRENKAKCTGQHPSCQRCRQSDITCIYSDKKRQRDAKFVCIVSRIAWYMTC